MEERMTIDEIGFKLMGEGYSPVVDDVDWYRVTNDEEDYYVYVGHLPDVFVEKRIMTNCFEYKNESWLLCCAMDTLNSLMSHVKVFMGASDDTLTFRIGMTPEDGGQFSKGLKLCLESLEKAESEFGHACSVMVRHYEKNEADSLMDQYSDPSPDSPLLQSKITS